MPSLPEPIARFAASLAIRSPGTKVKTEPGGAKAGNWWIDCTGKGSVTVEWRPEQGFGLWSEPEAGYGDGPNEIFASPERAAHRAAQLLTSQGTTRLVGLRTLRELFDVTQEQIAMRLRKGQAAVSRLENRNDSRIETITGFVKALGGQIEIRAVFPDAQLSIFSSSPAAKLKLGRQRSQAAKRRA